MKRLTLLTILLVVVGLTAGAIEVKPAFTLSGSGTLEWGIDLDDMGTGFKNVATGDLVISLMAADGTDTHAGTGDWYGSITISNVELYWTDGVATAGDAAANIAAKIVGMGGKLAIGVYGAPDLGLDFVAAIENADVDDTIVDIETELASDYDGPGTYVSYQVTDAVMLGFEIVSQYDYLTNETNGYAGALDFTLKFAPVTVAGGVNYGTYKQALVPPAWDDPVYDAIGFGVKVSADTAMVDPWVAFDGQANEGAFAWEVGAGATATFMETVTAAVSVVYGDVFDDLDVKVVFTEPAAAGLVDNLDLTLTTYLLDIAGAAGFEYEVILDGGYKMGVVYPNFTVTYGDANNNFPMMTVVVGVDYTAIPLTTLGLYWKSGDLLLGEGVLGQVIASAKVTY